MPSYRDFRPSVTFQETVALSPDGSRVAYADDGCGQFNVTVQPIDGGAARRLTNHRDHTVRRVVWHPDGTSLVYFADRTGNEHTQIYHVGLDVGEPPVPLTDEPAVEYAPALGYPFTVDGRLFAFGGNDRTPGDQDVLVREMATAAVRRVYAGGGQVQAGHWSPDGRRLSVSEWVDRSSRHVVYVVPAEGGPATRLTHADEPATYWLGPWLPDGSAFLVCSNAGREFTGLALMNATTGHLEWLDMPSWDVREAALSGDGRVVAWLVTIDGASQLRARDLATGRDLAVPALPAGEAGALTLSTNGDQAAVLLSTPTRPRNIVVANLEAGTVRQLTTAAPAVAHDRLIEPTLMRYASRDGIQIPAYVYRPSRTAEAGPVLMFIHGGPQSAERPMYVGLYQYLLSRGIAVFAPNVRGSTGYGKAYQNRVNRDWGGVDLDDWGDAVAHLRRQPWVDPSRIGLLGGSYGGFGVLSCLARLPEVDWAAAVVFFGISNLVTLAKASPPTWRNKVATIIGDPDEDRDFLLSRSPLTYADQIRAPLFVIQGANDRRVPRQESDQIVESLRRRGIDVRYDVYPDEGHGFTKTENAIMADSAAADFLVGHLTRP